MATSVGNAKAPVSKLIIKSKSATLSNIKPKKAFTSPVAAQSTGLAAGELRSGMGFAFKGAASVRRRFSAVRLATGGTGDKPLLPLHLHGLCRLLSHAPACGEHEIKPPSQVSGLGSFWRRLLPGPPDFVFACSFSLMFRLQ